MEGDGKVKFGYGVYLASGFKSAAHYSETKSRPAALDDNKVKITRIHQVELDDKKQFIQGSEKVVYK